MSENSTNTSPPSQAVTDSDGPAVLDDTHIGREARAASDDHLAVRLWLRLLSCSTQIEQDIRTQLRLQFATTLPRFDYLAQLERHPDGLRMNVLTRYLMVSGGNVTGLTDQLVADGWVERLPDPMDRRASIVRLSDLGRAEFTRMAQAHEAWLSTMFDGLGSGFKETLYAMLGQLRVHLAQSPSTPSPSAPDAAPVAPVGAPAATKGKT